MLRSAIVLLACCHTPYTQFTPPGRTRQNSPLGVSPTEILKSEHVNSNCPFTPRRQTRRGQDRFVVSGVAM